MTECGAGRAISAFAPLLSVLGLMVFVGLLVLVAEWWAEHTRINK